ncbi:MAG TPA: PaaI family thioesterase [Streptosporangiaceae bacterium]|nr:PaaI family thioesterase [Streptosporangiaceae bacterium]
MRAELPSDYDVTVADICFGCGKDNPQGLHIAYVDEPDGSTGTTLSLSWLHSGEPAIVHGGIQATVLDEVLGRAAQRAVTKIAGEGHTIVTANFELKYCAPCPTDQQFTARAYVDHVDWPSIFVAGQLTNPEGLVLTEAKARWRVLGPDSSSPGPA